MDKKRTIIALMVLSGVACAAPLHSEDWWNEAAEECFTFHENGTLAITSNTSGKELYYITEGKAANPMQNGSGLSVTFQFDTKKFLGNPNTALYIAFHDGNKSGEEADGKDYRHRLTVQNIGGETPLNIYEYSHYSSPNTSFHDVGYTLNLETEITTFTVNYTIRDNMLCYRYAINNDVISEEITMDVLPEVPLDWRPSFGLSDTTTNVFTVTDVTFISVPEPAAATLFLMALAGLTVRRRR